ncbi:MAG: pyrroline-5-carboxylate reductase, partial [Thermogutta sp.]|nr:pyrroline-5-carboxylate reductase [Thermogutta sp.]
VIFLAVKPQSMNDLLAELAGQTAPDRLIVSIAAGVSLAKMESALGKNRRVVRVMPNTPCLVGQGATGYALGSCATEEDGRLVGELLSAVGAAVRVEERLMDAVTALSGSGPAFAYLMIEALADAGVRHGLPRDTARLLAAQTLKGAAEMVLVTGTPPSVLKEQVTSPAGTTIAGLVALESAGFRGAVFAAVQAAAERSAQLGG